MELFVIVFDIVGYNSAYYNPMSSSVSHQFLSVFICGSHAFSLVYLSASLAPNVFVTRQRECYI